MGFNRFLGGDCPLSVDPRYTLHQRTENAQEKLRSYEVSTAILSYGSMTYVDAGEGDVILSVHGIFGGYDQAYDSAQNRASKNRVLAPSRWLSRFRRARRGTPKEQAVAFEELLDHLDIDRVFVLATSAGGTPPFVSLDYRIASRD